MVAVVYADDFLFGSDCVDICKDFVANMKKELKMSMLGELSFFLGLQILRSKKGIFISQTKYIREMFKRFRMEDCNHVSTPMVMRWKLSKDDESPNVNQTYYRSMVGSLL